MMFLIYQHNFQLPQKHQFTVMTLLKSQKLFNGYGAIIIVRFMEQKLRFQSQP